MNKSDIILKKEIMARVRFIYSLRKVVSNLAPKFLALTFMISTVSVFVSIPNVIRNMPDFSQMAKFFEFTSSAFVNTNLLTQAICLGILAVLFYAIRDILRAFRTYVRPLSVM